MMPITSNMAGSVAQTARSETSGRDKVAPIVISAIDLAEAAERIRSKIRKTTGVAIEVGRELIAVKAAHPGQFLSWVENEVGLSASTAESWMQLARRADEFPKIGNLPPSVAYRLAAKSVPTVMIERFVGLVERGNTIRIADVNAAIKQAHHQHCEAEDAGHRRILKHPEEAKRRAQRKADQAAAEEKQREVAVEDRATELVELIGVERAERLVKVLLGPDGPLILEAMQRQLTSQKRAASERLLIDK